MGPWAASNPPVWFAALFPVIFAGMWVGVIGLIALMSGWRCLARAYATTEPPPPGARRFQTARLGLARYKNVLTVGHSPAGLWVGTFFLFRPFHPPLLIPWEKISERKKVRWFFTDWEQFKFDGLSVGLAGTLLPDVLPAGSGPVGAEVARGLSQR